MSAGLTEISPGFYADTDYRSLLSQAGLDSAAAVFAFQEGENLGKSNLAGWRQRIRFQLPNGEFAYLKRYVQPPKTVQLKAWMQHRRRAFLSYFDRGPAEVLRQAKITIPKVIAYGGQWQGLFERRSFIITLELRQAVSLEKKLPGCFDARGRQKERSLFIEQLADFIRRFHAIGFRHRDLYTAHVFHSEEGTLSLIDLHRCFRPMLLKERFRIKDLAQLHYSARGDVISRADRVRFWKNYTQTDRLSKSDKIRIGKIHAKALRIARHDRKHGRVVPFALTGYNEKQAEA